MEENRRPKSSSKTARRLLVMAGVLTSGTLMFGRATLGGEILRFHGVVKALTVEKLTLESPETHQRLEFDRSHSSAHVSKRLKVGDPVDLWYTYEGGHNQIVRNPGNPAPQAGEVEPPPAKKTEPLPLKDDRIYFNADAGDEKPDSTQGSSS